MTAYVHAAALYREAVELLRRAPDNNKGLRAAARLLRPLSRADLMSTALWREHERLLPDRFLWGNLEPAEARSRAAGIERLAARIAQGV